MAICQLLVSEMLCEISVLDDCGANLVWVCFNFKRHRTNFWPSGHLFSEWFREYILPANLSFCALSLKLREFYLQQLSTPCEVPVKIVKKKKRTFNLLVHENISPGKTALLWNPKLSLFVHRAHMVYFRFTHLISLALQCKNLKWSWEDWSYVSSGPELAGRFVTAIHPCSEESSCGDTFVCLHHSLSILLLSPSGEERVLSLKVSLPQRTLSLYVFYWK